MTETVSLTVNGDPCTVTVSARTQLAEILRDHLDLTGTHLGCEQGVCGACTVLMNGRPVRSCITFAVSCEGAAIETVEGYSGDAAMDRLRAAFSRHHALQCGFCTPGMLATAHDIVARFDDPDEATIRRELSGNLCRCTGYVGIVSAIRDVIEQRNREAGARAPSRTHPAARPRPFAPFDPIAPEAAAGGPAPHSGSMTTDGGWTAVRRQFALPHAPGKVWDLFGDLRKAASCIPGAAIDSVDADRFSGAVEIRFGPIGARFGGRGTFTSDPGARAGTISGQGEDRLGRSRVRGELRYAVMPGAEAGTSRADVELRFQIQGMLAQFNRPELVTGFVDHILERFAANCDAALSGREAGPAKRLSALAILWALLKGRFSRRRSKSRES